ncbi:MAG: ankyrin repeat domain-containing protein [Bacteroidota bacterium]
MKRKTFLKTGLLSLASLGLTAKSIARPSLDPDPLPVDLVEEFVRAGHSDLDKVKAMLKETPNLIYAQYDWGNGDFEAAIEGAGHLGKKEIAEYLIGQGARANIFVLTMLGKTELVKPMLEAYPQLIRSKGPHGFTLLHHAKKGGAEAEALQAYLLEKGLTETMIKIR